MSGNITGKRFGMLLVTEKAKEPGKWKCVCDCGKYATVRRSNLNSGNTASCGCQRGCRRHGMHETPEYNVYMAMKQRCLNESNRFFSFYGGRGITVCDRWLGPNGFLNFISDMGRRPSKRHSLDRLDNSLGYSPDNCRWATRKQQQNNMRANRTITHNGKTMTAAQWARELGFHPATIQHRLNRGWSPKRVLETPAASNGERFVTYNGKTQNIAQWAKEIGVKEATIRARLNKGWSAEKALTHPLRKACS